MNIIKEITSGYRCKTFVVEEEGKKFLYQEYSDSAYYQAKKKHQILEKIANNYSCEFIPKSYKYFNLEDKSVLYTELKQGESLSKIREEKNDFSISKIAKDFSETLYKIHSIKDSDCFGWITDNGCIGKPNFYDYIMSEFQRFEPTFKDKLSDQDYNYIMEQERRVENYIKNILDLKPQLVWYDLNPENILIKDNKLSSIVDPGGAKYAIKELDLAFVKYEICNNDKEFLNILYEYKKLDKSVDGKLIDILGILVELDDIILRLQDNIYIPIPYCSNFIDLINKIQKGNTL